LETHADIILLDPPRAGLDKGVLQRLVQMEPERIIYISCDQTSLARDMRKLISQGYQILDITPFDLFPQTFHLESISILQKIKG
jgi:23S rRNA (uracil1939-C5)-methyltransferase